jgi:DNA-binding CsgD family transcriptional regulator
VIAWTSPRTTQLLHQRGDLARLAHIGLVLHEISGFGREPGSAPLALGGLGNGLAGGLGAADSATARDFVELSKTVAPEPEGERGRSRRHAGQCSAMCTTAILFRPGTSVAEIADELVLFPLTAKTHVARLFSKLDARDRAQLVVGAYETGLIVPGER